MVTPARRFALGETEDPVFSVTTYESLPSDPAVKTFNWKVALIAAAITYATLQVIAPGREAAA